MPIIWPSNTESIISQIRDIIGRPIDFVIVVSSYDCPDCDLDPITNKSDDSFCQTCEGEHWIPIYDIVTVSSAHIIWGPSDIDSFQTGGIIYGGDCTVQIKYTPENVVLADTAISILVDGKEMEVKKKALRGVQPLNRMILSLTEKDND